MSDHVRHSGLGFKGRIKESEHAYQSVWMAHWMRIDCDAKGRAGNDETVEHPGAISQIEMASDISSLAKQPEEVESRTFDIMNQCVRKGNLRNYEDKVYPSIPVDGCHRRDRKSSTLLKVKESRNLRELTPLEATIAKFGEVNRCSTSSSFPSPAAAVTEILSREHHSQHNSEFQKTMGKVTTHAFFKERSYVVSRPFQENLSGSASDAVLLRSDISKKCLGFERTELSLYIGDQCVHPNKQLPSSNLKQTETERYHHHSHLANLLCSKSINNHISCGKSVIPYSRQKNLSFLLKDTSTSGKQLSHIKERLQVHNFSGLRQLQFPTLGSSPELTRLEEFHDGYSSPQDFPPSVHDVETMKLCASVDSMVGLSGGHPGFSHTTQSKLITKNTGVRFEGKEAFNDASEVDERAFVSSSSPFPAYGQKGVKIQSHSSVSDSEGNKNIENTTSSETTFKNASSEETDVMDIDAFAEKHHISGAHLSPSEKASQIALKTSQFSFDKSATEVGEKHINSELPDMNLDHSAINNTTDGAEPSSSKTQSLNMDLLLLGHAEQTNHSVSGPCEKAYPISRRAKRLRSCASDSIEIGTQSSNLEDVSMQKMKRLSNTITFEQGGRSHEKELVEPDESTTFKRDSVSSSVNTARRSRDLLLSQSWFQRWLHNQAGTPQKQPEAVALCEPQSSKLEADNFQKKQFPSIAAMALMGKAMNVFQPCELQNRGSFVVWNSKGF